MTRSWKSLVSEIVEHLPTRFSLDDVLAYKDHLARSYPDNRHIEAKIRQTLQMLRDGGVLMFEGRGRYTRIRDQPKFSPLIAFDPDSAFKSKQQIARVVLETWAEFNLFCVNCTADSLIRLSANTPVADFACAECDSRYQIKSKDGRFGGTIPGAAYAPMIAAIRSKLCPHYVLVEYDRRYSTVVFAAAIAGDAIGEERVIARRPLATSARRAGWIGCTIRIEGLPKVALVEPTVIEPEIVRSRWRDQLQAAQ